MRHGKDPPLWTAILGIVAALCTVGALVYLLVAEPGKETACYYASGSVTVEVVGPDCTPVLRFVASDTDREWVATSLPQGSVYSQLEKGRDTVRIFDHGEPRFADALQTYFQKAQWRVVAPSPSAS